jgi:N-acetyl-gamma-glutamyl-phosphate reductase
MAAKARIFIDGEHGTTGLQIRQRLAGRGDFEILSVPEAMRRDASARAERLNAADIAILCLPDDGAREAVAMLEQAGNNHTRVIDTSTAHRTAQGWAYGFPELTAGQSEVIAAARYVANPGCYPTGAIGLLRPLVEAGVMPTDYPVTINAVSGYTGGGKAMIAQMEDKAREDHIDANLFLYGLTLVHKHVPEIVSRTGLTRRPVFTPNVGRFAQGMLVNVPLHLDLLPGNPDIADLHAVLVRHYAGASHVEVAPLTESGAAARVSAEEMRGTDRMRIYVFGTPGKGQANLVASLDNLGKGASGAAVQNMEIMLAA